MCVCVYEVMRWRFGLRCSWACVPVRVCVCDYDCRAGARIPAMLAFVTECECESDKPFFCVCMRERVTVFVYLFVLARMCVCMCVSKKA